MRYSESYTITPDMPQGYIEVITERAEQDIAKALLSRLEFGQWYAVKMEHHTEHEGGIYRGVVSLHIDKARTERASHTGRSILAARAYYLAEVEELCRILAGRNEEIKTGRKMPVSRPFRALVCTVHICYNYYAD